MNAAPVVVCEIAPWIVLVAFGSLSAAAAGWAVVLAERERDPLPVAACVGALVCALNEPIYDLLGNITYAQNHPMAFNALGRDIPWFLVLGYLPWVGLLPYLVARRMAAGVSRRSLHLLALVSALSVVAVELAGTAVGAWAYYGPAPLKYLVVAPQMAPVPVVGGFLLYTIAFGLTGWRRALAGLVSATMALPMVFAAASWPLYVGLNSDVGAPLAWMAGAAMLGLTVAMVVATTGLAQRWRRGELALAGVSGAGRES
ncbi:MAG: hypothetical protein JJLCMIEE_01113 [Acidimicrobiales bacterium]|nr:MAG: hypothetical protein EDR02_11560 [Actinomycetota bacterium]MBV6508054.1 hypothetical protein [Acidimicrobiales bacterium]RIK05319.1 MAG: hypothetical protein DCC48_10600 [Acidobacteriota bacterium]